MTNATDQQPPKTSVSNDADWINRPTGPGWWWLYDTATKDLHAVQVLQKTVEHDMVFVHPLEGTGRFVKCEWFPVTRWRWQAVAPAKV
jgi:hypothetical protein